MRPFCPARWVMQLISLNGNAICRNYVQKIMWLQEVDEQDRTDSGVKAGGFRQMLRKFKTFFHIEILSMVFSVVESANVQLQSAQLNFCSPEYNFLRENCHH